MKYNLLISCHDKEVSARRLGVRQLPAERRAAPLQHQSQLRLAAPQGAGSQGWAPRSSLCTSSSSPATADPCLSEKSSACLGMLS